ncbi:hypothetical protein [Sinorhizobium alkalisoli]|uniref:Uncharacterized protein n=1 Tax=Sinorhizobium alkalisoli TaxID=1752398 RepID=A0A1E3VI47_9HYPH|nr:hypothetical protein [Sinorhizobium alkalisoli]MCG5480234.1 hypothetical protein [Sinorhizobium alkalisoli]ODR93214.1 hypothetical protein A8M32_00875 [Sinorhizobium alkalisoli]
MLQSSHWISFALIVAVLPFLGGQVAAGSLGKDEPAHVEPVPGSKFNRVTLKRSAVERLGIETVAVRQMLAVRKRQVAAIVMNASDLEKIGVAARVSQPAAGLSPAARDVPATYVGMAWLRVLPISDAPKVAQDQLALVMPLVKGSGFRPLPARFVFPSSPDSTSEGGGSLYYVVDDAGMALLPQTRVLIELPYMAVSREAIPFSAVFFDEHGQAWVYTTPEPLKFMRHPILVDYVSKDLAFLSEGPPVGTEVVTTGASMLYGIEFGVGH